MDTTKAVHTEIHIGIIKSTEIAFNLQGEFRIDTTNLANNTACLARLNNDEIQICIGDETINLPDKSILYPSNLTNDTFEINDVIIGVDFHWEQKENQVFQGALKLMKMGNEIQAINILPIENYLKSVISSEMSANSSLNLLKAHAIISRSWLLAQIQKQQTLSATKHEYNPVQQSNTEYIRWYDREDHEHFHVCADDHCQRYQGITKAHNPNVIRAVEETCGEVLMHQKQICDARFSKACGGVSELFENCWEPAHHNYLTKVVDNTHPPKGYDLQLTTEANASAFINGNPDAFCNTNDEKILSQVLNNYDHAAKDFYRWEVVYNQNELASLLKKKSGRDFGHILDFIPMERGESARLIKVKIVGSKQTLIVGKELEIRRWLSESHLYSSAINIEKEDIQDGIPGKFIIHGAGWGHGVGLCQIGAAVMGEKGYTYKEILMHYYKNAKIEKYY